MWIWNMKGDLSENGLIREFNAFKHHNSHGLILKDSVISDMDLKIFIDAWSSWFQFLDLWALRTWFQFFESTDTKEFELSSLVEPGNLYFNKGHRRIWKSCQSNLCQSV